MLVDDIIKATMISVVDGLNSSNTMYFKVLATPTTDTVAQTLTHLATSWWDSVKDLLSNQVILACADWTNLTQNEDAIVYPALTGNVVEDHHPAISFLNIHGEGWEESEPTPRVVGKWSNRLSGIAKAHTTRDRLNTIEITSPWETWMTVTHLLNVDQANLQPMVRHDTAGKAWRDSGSPDPPGKPPASYVYRPMQTAHADKIIRASARRKTRLCA